VSQPLRFGAIPASAVHLCIDMQTMFTGGTEWHVPWMRRILPRVLALTRKRPDRTVFTRFVPPDNPDSIGGTWRRYYHRWPDMTRDRLDPAMVSLLPELLIFVPPAMVVDKWHYSPFAEPRLYAHLQEGGVDTLILSGAETDVCVLATVLSAVDLGYRVIVASDALCSVSDETHDALLTLYSTRFGQQIEVADVDTILGSWQ